MTKPTKKAEKRFMENIRKVTKGHKGCKQESLIRMLNCLLYTSRPRYDGSHQQFPGLDLRGLGIEDLYPSQKDAIWMIKQNGGGICDHEAVSYTHL